MWAARVGEDYSQDASAQKLETFLALGGLWLFDPITRLEKISCGFKRTAQGRNAKIAKLFDMFLSNQFLACLQRRHKSFISKIKNIKIK